MSVPPVISQKAKLRDGETVTLRTIYPEDAPRLQALFNSLSPNSRYFRFMSCIKHIPDEWTERLANVDYPREMALTATCQDGDQVRMIADARYTVEPFAEVPSAEFAIAVHDEFQHRGLGTILIKQLAAFASARGIQRFTALIDYENYPMLQFLAHSGFAYRRIEKGPGQVRLAVEIEEASSENGCPDTRNHLEPYQLRKNWA